MEHQQEIKAMNLAEEYYALTGINVTNLHPQQAIRTLPPAIKMLKDAQAAGMALEPISPKEVAYNAEREYEDLYEDTYAPSPSKSELLS